VSINLPKQQNYAKQRVGWAREWKFKSTGDNYSKRELNFNGIALLCVCVCVCVCAASNETIGVKNVIFNNCQGQLQAPSSILNSFKLISFFMNETKFRITNKQTTSRMSIRHDSRRRDDCGGRSCKVFRGLLAAMAEWEKLEPFMTAAAAAIVKLGHFTVNICVCI